MHFRPLQQEQILFLGLNHVHADPVRCRESFCHLAGAINTLFLWPWWRIGRVEAFRPEGRGFESSSSRGIGTLGKFLTHSCLWRFGVKLRHSIPSVSGALHSSSGLERALYTWR